MAHSLFLPFISDYHTFLAFQNRCQNSFENTFLTVPHQRGDVFPLSLPSLSQRHALSCFVIHAEAEMSPRHAGRLAPEKEYLPRQLKASSSSWKKEKRIDTNIKSQRGSVTSLTLSQNVSVPFCSCLGLKHCYHYAGYRLLKSALDRWHWPLAKLLF